MNTSAANIVCNYQLQRNYKVNSLSLCPAHTSFVFTELRTYQLQTSPATNSSKGTKTKNKNKRQLLAPVSCTSFVFTELRTYQLQSSSASTASEELQLAKNVKQHWEIGQSSLSRVWVALFKKRSKALVVKSQPSGPVKKSLMEIKRPQSNIGKTQLTEFSLVYQ